MGRMSCTRQKCFRIYKEIHGRIPVSHLQGSHTGVNFPSMIHTNFPGKNLLFPSLVSPPGLLARLP